MTKQFNALQRLARCGILKRGKLTISQEFTDWKSRRVWVYIFEVVIDGKTYIARNISPTAAVSSIQKQINRYAWRSDERKPEAQAAKAVGS